MINRRQTLGFAASAAVLGGAVLRFLVKYLRN